VIDPPRRLYLDPNPARLHELLTCIDMPTIFISASSDREPPAWKAAHAGMRLANPSRSVRAYHPHTSGVRRYAHRWMDGTGWAVVPVHLDASGIPRQA
jgi:hypothetical protein